MSIEAPQEPRAGVLTKAVRILSFLTVAGAGAVMSYPDLVVGPDSLLPPDYEALLGGISERTLQNTAIVTVIVGSILFFASGGGKKRGG